MHNSSILKNELLFQYAAGTASLSKSLMASTYLFLNSKELLLYSEFENYCGEEFNNVSKIKPRKLTAEQCISKERKLKTTSNTGSKNPINKFIDRFANLKWEKKFNGFYEHSFKLSDKEKAKLIKMNQGAKVPLHSHNGKEYILVLEGSFSDEYGTYSKGDLQINDSRIKHTPVACKKEGCVCLTITEEDLVFYGPFSPLLNLITFIKSIFLSK